MTASDRPLEEGRERAARADHEESGDAPDSIASILDHPMLGRRPRRTGAAIGYLAVLVAVFLVDVVGASIALPRTSPATFTATFDATAAVFIVVATLSITVVPLVYAVWNGGPALALSIAVAPVVLAAVAAEQVVLGLDTAIALTVGAAASVLAVFANDVQERGSFRPWRRLEADAADGTNRLPFVTVVSVVALVGAVRFVRSVPSYVLEWYAPFGLLWLVPLALLPTYWNARIRTVARPDREAADVQSSK